MEDSHVVEKILGCRIRKPTLVDKVVHNDGDAASDEKANEVDEFFVKYKNL